MLPFIECPPAIQVLYWVLHIYWETSHEPSEVGKSPVESEQNEAKGLESFAW
jgi:hypothetical protein